MVTAAVAAVTEPAIALPTPQDVLADPAASYWLKDAIRALLERDPVDAACDAEVLAMLFSNPDAVAEMADRMRQA